MKMGEAGKTVRLGILGLGCRGYEQTALLASMPDIRIQAIYDPYPDRMDRMVNRLSNLVSWPTEKAESEANPPRPRPRGPGSNLRVDLSRAGRPW